jgi:hypothetical protein
MNTSASIITLLLIGLIASSTTAEVEYEIHTGYSGAITCHWPDLGDGQIAPSGFPILFSLTDASGIPIKSAIVVLKRLGPDGWTEEELKREKDSITDKNGMVVVMYPDHTATEDESGRSSVAIYGAVTVIAEGYRTVTIELSKYFKDGICFLGSDNAPHLKLSLQNVLATGDVLEPEVEQPVDGELPAPQAPR